MSGPHEATRATPAGLARALGLAWHAGRWHLLGHWLLVLVEAGIPVAVAWSTKYALDAIVDPALGVSVLVAAGVGLAVAGVARGVLPHASGYLQAEFGRRIGLLAQDRLFTAAERFVGLRRFEDPVFLDRLNLAQQSGSSTPAMVITGAFGISRSVITVGAFIGSLLLLSPVLAAGVLAAVAPALLAEWKLSRQRTSMMWRISPVQRREFFSSSQRDMDPAELRQRIGGVFQDYMEYDLSAAENIGLGDLERAGDRAAIERAAGKAGIHDKLASLPRGYDTMLTRTFVGATESENPDPETGVVLSGGQWQRLAIARALLRDERDLLILDEPSAGLDAEAEYEVHRTLRGYRRGRTSLLISHRLGAVRDADTLVVLDGGQVVEQGTHAELMAAGGVYASLFSKQASGYQAPEPWKVAP